MPSFPKPSDRVIRSFDQALPPAMDVERRAMFGHPCAFVNGNMFTGLFGDELVVRVANPDDAIARGAKPFDPMGRPMKAYVVCPEGVSGSAREMRKWIEEALTFTRALPAANKARRGAAARKSAAKRRGVSAKKR